MTKSFYWLIMYLTRQPEGRCGLPVPVKIKAKIIVLFFLREQGGYFLCVYVRIATISNATEVINCNFS